MASTSIKSRQESSRSLSYKAKSFVGKCEREFRELKQRADKYFDDLDKVEEMCQRAKQDVERIQLEAQVKKEMPSSKPTCILLSKK